MSETDRKVESFNRKMAAWDRVFDRLGGNHPIIALEFFFTICCTLAFVGSCMAR